MSPATWIRINHHNRFIVFRAEDVQAIEPVLSPAFSVKCYYVTLKISNQIIRLSIDQAERLAEILKPIDLSSPAEDTEIVSTIDNLLDSLGENID
jgi:hypothetical protein